MNFINNIDIYKKDTLKGTFSTKIGVFCFLIS